MRRRLTAGSCWSAHAASISAISLSSLSPFMVPPPCGPPPGDRAARRPGALVLAVSAGDLGEWNVRHALTKPRIAEGDVRPVRTRVGDCVHGLREVRVELVKLPLPLPIRARGWIVRPDRTQSPGTVELQNPIEDDTIVPLEHSEAL